MIGSMKWKLKLLLRNALFLLLLIKVARCCESIDDLLDENTRATKNGIVKVETTNDLIILQITKSDGSYMRNVLHTNEDITGQTFDVDTMCDENTICVKNGNVTYTRIVIDPNSEIVHISRSVPNPNAVLIDCYELGEDTEWYGGPQWRYQHWPIQKMYFQEEPYVTTHPENMALAERYWLSSKGVYIYVSETDPLFLDQNNYKQKNLCLISRNKAPYRSRDVITLNYEIGLFAHPRLAHESVVNNHFGKPTGHPNERMIMHPIWSTWAKYKVYVNEDVVNQFANEIIENGFNNSQIEIDDNWETCYGSAIFDPDKFPDVPTLMQQLKNRGFRVTLWIHPFINEGCEPAYSTALQNSYFVKNLDGSVKTAWWQGSAAAAIDFTNPNAVAWWVARLKSIQQMGVDSFKFDAGESSWLPQTPSLSGDENRQPGIFTYDYVNALSRNFDDSIEVRVGWRSQQLPIFVRMIDKDSRWSMNNGLPTLITTLLQMNLNGYVHVLPDMIGGNGYVENTFEDTAYPAKELFIRWLQANVFMPSLQYSFVPWDYDDETIAISKKFTDLHAKITPKIISAMNKAITSGTPVNSPIWWIDPTNTDAHKISDEYLLGEDILVAPVIEEGAISRDIYLPTGKWMDGNTNSTYTGPRWLLNYSAPLDVLPYFVLV